MRFRGRLRLLSRLLIVIRISDRNVGSCLDIVVVSCRFVLAMVLRRMRRCEFVVGSFG